MKSDTIELIPIPEENGSPSGEMDQIRDVLDQAQRRAKVLEEGSEARALQEGERAIQELEFIAISARTVQGKLQAAIKDLEEERSKFFNPEEPEEESAGILGRFRRNRLLAKVGRDAGSTESEDDSGN